MKWINSYFEDRAESKFLASLTPIQEITRVELDPPLGRNVVATEKINAGSLLGVYPGVKLSLVDYLDKHELLDNAIRYSYRLTDEIVIDPTDIFGYLVDKPELRLALVNEAPPEKQINVLSLSSSNNVWHMAIREIDVGEALYTFYGPTFSRDYSHSLEGKHIGIELSEGEISLLREAALQHKWLREGIEGFFNAYFEKI